MQSYSTLVVQQPDISLDIGIETKVLQGLSEQQEASKQQARYFLDGLQPQAIEALTDITAYAGVFSAFRPAIVNLLPKIHQDDNARSRVATLVGHLEMEADRRLRRVRDFVGELRDYRTRVAEDVASFAALVDEANQLIAGDQGELKRLQDEIAATRQKIRGEIGGVVISSLVVVGGAITIGVGILGEFETAGTSTSVVLAGIGLVASGAAGLAAMAAAVANGNEKLRAAYKRCMELSATLTAVTGISGQLADLGDATHNMDKTSQSLQSEWASALAGITSFRESIMRASDTADATRLVVLIEQADKEWSALANNARHMLTQLVELAPQSVENVTAMAGPASSGASTRAA
jgi:hypothetical protein